MTPTVIKSHIPHRANRPRKWKFLAAVLATLVICTQLPSLRAYSASQLYPAGHALEHAPRPECIFEISGEVDQSTVAYVKEQYRLKEQYATSQKGKISSCMLGRPGVWLNSLGGDLESALEIGKFLREKRVVTIVPNNARCASACVIIFLGGIHRMVTGDIGIHRPYNVGLSDSVQKSQKSYASTNTSLISYFEEMNIPRKLLDAMNAVPPDKVRWLDLDENNAFGLSGTDPAWQDYQDSVAARNLGISKETLYKRRTLAKTSCAQERNFTQRMLCEQKVILGK